MAWLCLHCLPVVVGLHYPEREALAMQYLHKLPNGQREPVTKEQWQASSFVDKDYQVVMHTPMVLVYRTHDARKMPAPERHFYGGRIGRHLNSLNGWGGN